MKREQDIKEAEGENLVFKPTINRKSISIERGFGDLMADTHRRLQEKQTLENRLKTKERVSGTQINATSDKVIHDRFDNDFNFFCAQLGIFDEPKDGEETI
mmetsp:Transcript_42012/g.64351  ORF Transcript_42012/g.64351 Transcript_42012/m.64351 type:complete len:101 (-) Transcript_42012:983-1285(-)